ncbi:MAG: hypothetical protein IIY71_05015 [Oscillospiraceae bacterium]|nr:hypothetical protein [Oscillospiraceae bacterium]
MKHVMAALLLFLMLMTGLAACKGNVTDSAVTSEPLVTADVLPGENTLPGSGVPTAPPASPQASPKGVSQVF